MTIFEAALFRDGAVGEPDLEGPGPRERGQAGQGLDGVLADQGRQDADLAQGRLVPAFEDGLVIDRGVLVDRDPVTAGLLQALQEVGRVAQDLAGQGPRPDAAPAELELAVDHQDFRPESGALERGRNAGLAPADDDQIISAHGAYIPYCRAFRKPGKGASAERYRLPDPAQKLPRADEADLRVLQGIGEEGLEGRPALRHARAISPGLPVLRVQLAVDPHRHGTSASREVTVQAVFQGGDELGGRHTELVPKVPIHAGDLALRRVEIIVDLLQPVPEALGEAVARAGVVGRGDEIVERDLPQARVPADGRLVVRAAAVEKIGPREIAVRADALLDAGVVDEALPVCRGHAVIARLDEGSPEALEVPSGNAQAGGGVGPLRGLVGVPRPGQVIDAPVDLLFPLLDRERTAVRVGMRVDADLVAGVDGRLPGPLDVDGILLALGGDVISIDEEGVMEGRAVEGPRIASPGRVLP